MRHLDLFSGIGGFALGLHWAGGFETVGFCEQDAFCQGILAKHWPAVPCYEDIRTLTYAQLCTDGLAPIDCIPEDSLANPGALQGTRTALMMPVISGQKCTDLLLLVVRDGSLRKMCRALMMDNSMGSTEHVLTWRLATTQCKRWKFRLVPSMPRTNAPDSGLWPTPLASMPGSGTTGMTLVAQAVKGASKLWPTMTASHGATGALRPAEGIAEHKSRLENVVAQTIGTTQSGSLVQTEPRGGLNPAWVCWIMGYPAGWLD